MEIVEKVELFEIELTPDEVTGFEKLREMEAIHNEVAGFLGVFMDQIMKERNRHVKHISSKYRIKNPSQMTFDPFRRMIVSIFDPRLQGHKIEDRSASFRQVAQDKMMGIVKELTDLFKATQLNLYNRK